MSNVPPTDRDILEANAVAFDRIAEDLDFFKLVHPKLMALPGYVKRHLNAREVSHFLPLMDGCIFHYNDGPYPILHTHILRVGSVDVSMAYILPLYEDLAWRMYALLSEKLGERAKPKPVNNGYARMAAFRTQYHALIGILQERAGGDSSVNISLRPASPQTDAHLSFIFRYNIKWDTLEHVLGVDLVKLPEMGVTLDNNIVSIPPSAAIPPGLFHLVDTLTQLPLTYADTDQRDSLRITETFEEFRQALKRD